ncbi:hypothetical protein CA831_38910, partial [Burkholderia multivorans]
MGRSAEVRWRRRRAPALGPPRDRGRAEPAVAAGLRETRAADVLTCASCPRMRVLRSLRRARHPPGPSPSTATSSDIMSAGLNPAQNEAVRYLDGPCLVLAGA